jgi:predicted transcriptional regulator
MSRMHTTNGEKMTNVIAKTENKLSDLQLMIYDLICAAGQEGMTMEEVEVKIGRTHQSVSARINELEKMGLVKRRARKRKNKTGRDAWIYVKAGLERVIKDN